MSLFKIENGILVPVKKQKEQGSRIVLEYYVQQDLIQQQLGRYLEAINKADGIVEAVFRQPSGVGRYSVFYRAYKEVDTEIYC